MAHKTPGSACETFTTTGTGSVTLLGAVAGYETLAAAGLTNTDTFIGRCEAVDSNGIPTGDFEEALYTWTTGGVITRGGAVIKSSNSDAAVSWAAVTKRIYTIHPAMAVGGQDTSPAQLTANTNDWSVLSTENSVVRFSTDASRDITGLTSGFPGRMCYLHNVGSFNAVLKDESGSSTAGNRFALTGDLTIYPDMVIPLQYDATTARWRSMLPSTQTLADLTEDTTPVLTDHAITYDVAAAATKRSFWSTIRALMFAAGSATAGSWPTFGSGTLLTTPAKGDLEHDTECMYGTTDAGNRGAFTLSHIIRLTADYTLTNSTAEQKLFNASTNGRLTLETGAYFFECLASISALSATSGNGAFDILGAGGATLADVLYHSVGVDGNTATAATQTGSTMIQGQSPASQQTAGTGTTWNFRNSGSFEVTVAGTIVPSVTLVTASAGVVRAGSYFRCWRIGASGAATLVGQWD